MKNFSAIKEIVYHLNEGIENGTLKSTKELTIKQYLSGIVSFLMVFLAIPFIEVIELGIFSVILIIASTCFVVYYYICTISSVQYQRTTRFIKKVIHDNELNEGAFHFIFIDEKNIKNQKELKKHLKDCKNKLISKYNIKE